MEEYKSKVTWKIVIIIFCIVSVFYYSIFYSLQSNTYESNIIHDENKTKLNDTDSGNKTNPNITFVNETILLETDDYKVIKKIKRDKLIFTQGLLIDTPDTFIESGGLYSYSSLQRININNPDTILYNNTIQSKYFAEGCTLFKNKIYQLTWKENTM
jgi:hypothetical protein